MLRPSVLGLSGLRTFGWSLSGGQDLDGNEYPDLTVGSYGVDAALVLRTRPVVQLDAELRYQNDIEGLDGLRFFFM